MSLRQHIKNVRVALRRRLDAARHARRGRAHYRAGLNAEAADEYVQAVALCPGSPILHLNSGLALYAAGRRQDARAAWQTALALAEEDKPYVAEQARILLRQFG